MTRTESKEGKNPCCSPDEIIQFLIKNNECYYKIPFINLEADYVLLLITMISSSRYNATAATSSNDVHL